ncbi:MAG: hypothetical protein NTY12_04680 [Candidatus Falkowbacteria bacterium]|nr:hypothetical protein [Candidatus Falkowbacteria bacterium]
MEEKIKSEYLALRGLICSNYEPHVQAVRFFRPLCLVIAVIAGLGLILCAAAGKNMSGAIVPFAWSAILVGFGLFFIIGFAVDLDMQKMEVNALDDAVAKDIEFKDVELLKKYFPKVVK